MTPRPLATIYLAGDTVPLEVAETPLEVRELRDAARQAELYDGGDGLFEVTLADVDPDVDDGYLPAGRPAFIAAHAVSLIAPPLVRRDDPH